MFLERIARYGVPVMATAGLFVILRNFIELSEGLALAIACLISAIVCGLAMNLREERWAADWTRLAKMLADGDDGIRFSAKGSKKTLARQLSVVAEKLEFERKYRRGLEDSANRRLEAMDLVNSQLQESNSETKKLLERLEWQNAALASLNDRLVQLAYTDGLTGVKNHRTFQEMFRSAFANAKRYRQPLSLLLLDFDDFKKLNDAHGHLTGDAVLKHAARMLTARTRESDVVARYGGEEFAIVLPNTDLNGAMALAESIRVDIAKRAVVPFTVSIGCACYAEGVKTPDRLIALADESLYQAKRTGRNRIASVQAEPEKFRGSA